MDPFIAERLNSKSHRFDSELYGKLSRTAADYITAGQATLSYYIVDFDSANDMVQGYGTTSAEKLNKRINALPVDFIHPMGATEVTTLTTFLSQILFGGETTRKVEPRQPEDEEKADLVNELLAWNDHQQDTYSQGYHFIWDAVTFNRGVFYDRWAHLYEVVVEPVEETIPEIEVDDKRTKTRKRKIDAQTFTRFKKVRKQRGGYCKVDLISPYDFICDPTLPIRRMQEGRLAGHRVSIPWIELERRSKLDPEDYDYVLPDVVAKLKGKTGWSAGSNTTAQTLSATGSTAASRSALERQRRGSTGGTALPNKGKVNADDGGMCDCWVLSIRAQPKTFKIYDDEELETIEILTAGPSETLAVNILPNKHDQFPYSVGEARPNAHAQFSPSYGLLIRPLQDYVDYLKNRHKESLARTSGNIFVGNPAYVDFEDFMDPNKDGLFIPVTEEAAGVPLDQIIKQIPVTDTTARFHEEMEMWIGTADNAMATHPTVQGETEDPSQTLGQFETVQTMRTGRISTIARLLSVTALTPQTYRILSNLQQFMPDTQTIRVTGEFEKFNPGQEQERFKTIVRDQEAIASQIDEIQPEEGQTELTPAQVQKKEKLTSLRQMPDIQGMFDVVPSDGSLPGTDARKVAALSRAVEAYSSNPALAPAFDITKAGAVDPIKLFQKLLKKTGLPTGGLLITTEQAAKNAQAALMAQGGGMGMPPQSPQAPTPVPIDEATGIPSASELPPTPSAEPPRAHPANI